MRLPFRVLAHTSVAPRAPQTRGSRGVACKGALDRLALCRRGLGLDLELHAHSLKSCGRADDRRFVRRRCLLTLGLLAVLAPAATATAAKPKAATVSWAQPQIVTITAQGIMGTDPTTFRPDDPLTRGAAASLVASLTRRPSTAVTAPTLPVSIAGLDSRLVGALALQDAAATFAADAKMAGLAPPSRFGTEVVARLLGLRTNHPAARDDLELAPGDAATRAEAAFSAARMLKLDADDAEAVREAAATFTLPELTDWQKRVLTTAVGLIGYPYVWAGTSERPGAPAGVQTRGGFDCSGFVWRVYKLQAYAGAPTLPAVLKGRTTYQMSGEVPRAQRIGFADLAPGDVVFFGAKGPRSKPAEVNHMGIYLGNGWFIHSSGYGVALAELTGWYRTRFAWARRPLAEAGLSA
jgi:cell wall-associated NlpC family hydrolase